MANKVAIVTDSTAYIPQKYLDKYTIKVAPAVIIWGDEELRDNVDITADAYFKRLAESSTSPTTSQPSPASVKEHYDALHQQGYDILGIYISNKLSGTIGSAIQAKEMVPGANIEHVDTLSASMGAGWPILEAAKAAADGASLADCKAIAEKASKYTGVLLTVETLEYLHRGGRIGGAQKFIGTALNFKPILEVVDGRIEPVERVRTRSKALNRIVEVFGERLGDKKNIHLAAIHAKAGDVAQDLLNMAGEIHDLKESFITDVSPAVGTHTGPGTVGLAWMAGYE